MSITEAQKRATRKWDAENMTNICIRVRKEYAKQVHEICHANNTTASAIMKEAIERFIQEHSTQ